MAYKKTVKDFIRIFLYFLSVPTWQQEEMSLKFFSRTTVLLSGLMRFTSKRPTCDAQKQTKQIQTHIFTQNDDFMLQIMAGSLSYHVVIIDEELLTSRYINASNQGQQVCINALSYNRLLWMRHIEHSAPVFKITLMRKQAWCVRNGSWPTLRSTHF